MNLFVNSLVLFVTISSQTLIAQNRWCATDEHNETLLNNVSPEMREFFEQQREELFTIGRNNQSESGKVYTIPVVVHVIHYDCIGNISKAQIEDGIRVLNEDFRRINSDTGATRSLFKPFTADAEIEFKLAQIDPNGNCTEGIVRLSNPLSYDSRDEVKALSYWPSNKYFNVWIVNSIQSSSGTGTTLGYAQFPGGGSWSTYGIVVRNSSWGTIGTSNSDGRTATHEVGHAFGLFHTFQGACGSNCGNSGDRICDTPPTLEATWGCVTTQNTCSNDQNGSGSPYSSNVVDQIENYMSYDACTNMFTQDQIDVMRGALQFYSTLINLVSDPNLIATGTNSGAVAGTCAPQADFCRSETVICENQSLNFTDNSYNGPIGSRTWSFPGGIPATSSDSVVNVTYNTAGTYEVTLSVSNGTGTTTKKVTNLVTVEPSQAEFTNWKYTEDFENEVDFLTYWGIESEQGVQWEITSDAAYSGERSIYINNYITGVNGWTDAFISPSYDLSEVSNPVLTFKVAFQKKAASNTDLLRLHYSTNCGSTWNIMNGYSASTLATVDDGFGEFVPASTEEWKQLSAVIPVFIRTQKNVYFKFELLSGGGNNLYIDDINIQNPTGIEEVNKQALRIYPNPADDIINIESEDFVGGQILQLTDLSGKVVDQLVTGDGEKLVQLDVTSVTSGLYFIKIQGTDVVKKVVIR